MKALAGVSGQTETGLAKEVAATPFKNSLRQEWFLWSQGQFLDKGYPPETAEKWAEGVLEIERAGLQNYRTNGEKYESYASPSGSARSG